MLALKEVEVVALSADVDGCFHPVLVVVGPLKEDNGGDDRGSLGTTRVCQDEPLSHNGNARSVEGVGNARTVRRSVFDHRESMHRRHVTCCFPMGVGSDPRTGGAMRLDVVAPGGRAGGSDS